MTQLLVIGLIIGVFIAYRWLRRQPFQRQRYLATRFAIFAGAAILIVLLIRGVNPIIALVAGLLPATLTILRLLNNIRHVRDLASQVGFGLRRKSPAMLHLYTCGSRGRVEGEVLNGAHKGKKLSQLTESQLNALLAEWTLSNPADASILASYLNSRSTDAKGTSSQPPTQAEVEESLLLLGLSRTATTADVLRAHKRLIQRIHPDLGGSDYLAAKINRAREILLEWIDSTTSSAD